MASDCNSELVNFCVVANAVANANKFKLTSYVTFLKDLTFVVHYKKLNIFETRNKNHNF